MSERDVDKSGERRKRRDTEADTGPSRQRRDSLADEESSDELRERLRRASERATTRGEVEDEAPRARRRRRPTGESNAQSSTRDAEQSEGEESDGESGETETREERPSAWQRYDIFVAIGALAIFALGALAHRSVTAPQTTSFEHAGLEVERPAGWLPPRPIAPARSPLASIASTADAPEHTSNDSELPYHVELRSPSEPSLRLEIRIARRPNFSNLRSALGLDRVGRYGEQYWVAEANDVSIDGRDWLRTRFRYAHKVTKSGSPRVATGIEYASVNGTLLYVVTVHGEDRDVEALEELVAPTLRVDANAAEAAEERE